MVGGVGRERNAPLAQSTFDNMGAEASALRESLVILINVQKKSDDNMANFTQGVEEEVRFTVNGKEVVVGKEVGPQTRLARYQWLTWRDILAYGVPAHL